MTSLKPEWRRDVHSWLSQAAASWLLHVSSFCLCAVPEDLFFKGAWRAWSPFVIFEPKWKPQMNFPGYTWEWLVV